MNTIEFLSQLANVAHHHDAIEALINAQSSDVKNAIHQKNAGKLKKLLSSAEFYANESHVTQAELDAI
jgi:hypothetical protein